MLRKIKSYLNLVYRNKGLRYLGVVVITLSITTSAVITSNYRDMQASVHAYKIESELVSNYARYISSINATALFILDESNEIEADKETVLDIMSLANAYDPVAANAKLDLLIDQKLESSDLLVVPTGELSRYRHELDMSILRYNELSAEYRTYYVRTLDDVGYVINSSNRRSTNDTK